MKFKRTLMICASLILSVVLIFSNIGYSNISAAEYNINLSIETVQIDINSIPENRIVHLKMSIENNPGFSILYFVLQKDSRLSYYNNVPVSPYSYFDGVDNCFINSDTVNISIPSPENDFTQNGVFIDINVVLPQTVNIGDFYSVNLVSEYEGYQAAFQSANDPSKPFYNDNFTLSNGGISITGQAPAPAEPITPPQPQDPPQAPSVNNEPVNNPPAINPPQNNNTPAPTAEASPAATQIAITSLPQTSASASESSISDKVSGSSKPAVTTNKSSSSATSASATIITSNEESKNVDIKTDTKDKALKAPAIAAIIIIPAALIATGIFIYFKNKKEK